MKKTRSDQQERKKYHHFHSIMDGRGKDWAKLRPQANVHTLASTVMPSSLMRPGRSQTQRSVFTVCVRCVRVRRRCVRVMCVCVCVCVRVGHVRLRVPSSWLRGTSLVSMHSPSSISVLDRSESVRECFYSLPTTAREGAAPGTGWMFSSRLPSIYAGPCVRACVGVRECVAKPSVGSE